MLKRLFGFLFITVGICVIAGCGGSSDSAPTNSTPITITTLSEIGTIDTGDSADVAAYGDYLYYTGWNGTANSFGIVDFSDPTSPTILGTMAAGYAYGVDFDGRYAYVETDGSGDGIFTYGTVGVIDCLDPNNPVEVMENDLGSSSAYDSAISGKYYYNFSNDIIGVYDISTPTAMTHVTNILTDSVYFGRVVGDQLIVGDNSDLALFDISFPAASISEMGRLSIPGGQYGATASGTTAFMAGTETTNDVIYSIDISDPASPTILSSVVTPSSIGYEMRILGNYLLAVGDYDFVVIDVSDPANMTVVDSIALSNDTGWGFDISGKYAIVADDSVLRIILLY